MLVKFLNIGNKNFFVTITGKLGTNCFFVNVHGSRLPESKFKRKRIFAAFELTHNRNIILETKLFKREVRVHGAKPLSIFVPNISQRGKNQIICVFSTHVLCVVLIFCVLAISKVYLLSIVNILSKSKSDCNKNVSRLSN